MTILVSFTDITPAAYNCERAYCKWLALEWLPGCLVQDGNPFVIRENVFGGFEVHIKFEPRYFLPDAGGWRQDAVLLDYYATAPGSSVPISAGSAARGYVFAANVLGNVFAINQAGSTGRLWVFRLPAPPTSNWFQQSPDGLPDRFCLQQPDITTILPMPVCSP